jgi:hypothetical protein
MQNSMEKFPVPVHSLPMATQQRQIASFVLSSALSTDGCAIDLTLVDGNVINLKSITPANFTAAVAVLQATREAYYNWDDVSGYAWVSSGVDAPGVL